MSSYSSTSTSISGPARPQDVRFRTGCLPSMYASMALRGCMWLTAGTCRFLQQMFPVEEKKKEGDGDAVLAGEKAAAEDPRRPGFSLPLMTQNFRRFNAR